MDDRGNIYMVDEKKKEAKNIETGKVTKLTDSFSQKLLRIPDDKYHEVALLKNRKERREWYKKNKDKLKP